MIAVARRTALHRRSRLANGVAAVALLAGLAASPAHALPGAGSGSVPTQVQVNAGGGAPSFATASGTTTVTLGAQRTLLDWSNFNVAQGEAVNFQFGANHANWTVLNRVATAAEIDGQVNGYLGGTTPGGNIWIVSPNGLVIGKGASLSAGGLLLTTNVLAIADSQFLNVGNNSFSFTAPTASTLAGQTLSIGATTAGSAGATTPATLKATGGSLALIAPAVNLTAGAQVQGDARSTALFGAANGYTITFVDPAAQDSGLSLFSFVVDTPTSLTTTALTLAGSTTAGDVYAAGVSQSATVADLISVSGTVLADNARTEGGVVVLNAGGGVATATAGQPLQASASASSNQDGVQLSGSLSGGLITLNTGSAAADLVLSGAINASTGVNLSTGGTLTLGRASDAPLVSDTQVDDLTTPLVTLSGGTGMTVLSPQISAGSVALATSSGAITFNGAAGFKTLSLNAAGAITQQGGSTLTVQNTLTGVSGSGSVTLASAGNQIATLGASSAAGAFDLVDGRALTVSGAVSSGAGQSLSLNTTGSLTVNAALASGAAMALSATGTATGGAAPSVGGTYTLISASPSGALLSPVFTGSAIGDIAIKITGSGTFTDSSALGAPGNLSITDTGGSLALGPLTATNGDVRVVSLAGSVQIASATAGDDVLISGLTGVTVGAASLTNTATLANGGDTDSDTGSLDGLSLDNGVTGQRQLLLQATQGAVVLGTASGAPAAGALLSVAAGANTLATLSGRDGVTVALQSAAAPFQNLTSTQGAVNIRINSGPLSVTSATGTSVAATASSGSASVGSATATGLSNPSISVSGSGDAVLGSASFTAVGGTPIGQAALTLAAGSGTAQFGATAGQTPTTGQAYSVVVGQASSASITSTSGGVVINLADTGAPFTTVAARSGTATTLASLVSGGLTIATLASPGAVTLNAPAGRIDVTTAFTPPSSLSLMGTGFDGLILSPTVLGQVLGLVSVEQTAGDFTPSVTTGGPLRITVDAGAATSASLIAGGDLTVTSAAGMSLGALDGADVTLSAQGSGGLLVSGALTATGTATLSSSGPIDVGGTLSATTLTGHAAGAVTFVAPTALTTLAGFTSNGGFTLADAQALNVTAPVSDNGGAINLSTTAQTLSVGAAVTSLPLSAVPGGAGSVSLAGYGGLTVTSAIQATGGLTLRSTAGAIDTRLGSLQAASLTGSAYAGASLTGSNGIGLLAGFAVTTGDFSLADGQALIVTGPVTASAGAASLSTANGFSLTISGDISSGPSSLTTLSSGAALIQTAGTIGGGSASLTSAGATTLSGAVTLTGSGALSLISGAVLDESGGSITAASLTGSAQGVARLTGANSLSALNGFTSQGGFSLTDTGALTISGRLEDDPGPVTVVTSGALTLAGDVFTSGLASFQSGLAFAQAGGSTLQARSAQLTSGQDMTLSGALSLDTRLGLATLNSGGGIDGHAGGIAAATLTGSAAGPVALTGANAVGAIGAFTDTGGQFSFSQTGGLTVFGPIVATTGGISLASLGVLTLAGDIDAGAAPLSLAGAGSGGPGVVQTSGVLTGLLSATTQGGLSLGDANALTGIGAVHNTGFGDVSLVSATGLLGTGSIANDVGRVSVTTLSGALSLGVVSAAGATSDVLLQALGTAPGSASISVASLTVGRDLVLRGQAMQIGAADGYADVIKPIFTPGTGRNLSIQLTSGGFSAGAITPVGGELRLEALSGDVSVGSASAGIGIFMRANAGALSLGSATLTGTRLDGSPLGAGFDPTPINDGLTVNDGGYAVDVGGGAPQLGLTALGAVTFGESGGLTPTTSQAFTATAPAAVVSTLVSDTSGVTVNLASASAPLGLVLARGGTASVSVLNGNLAGGDIRAASGATVSAANGSLQLGYVQAQGGSAIVQAGGDIVFQTLAGARSIDESRPGVVASGSLAVHAGGSITTATGVAAPSFLASGGAGGVSSLTLAADLGGITLQDATADQDVSITSGLGGVAVLDALSAGRDLTVVTRGALTLPLSISGRDATIQSSGPASLGTLLTGVDATITAAGALSVSNLLGAGGSANLISTGGAITVAKAQVGAGSGPAGDPGPVAGLPSSATYAALAAAEPSHDLGLTASGAVFATDAWASGAVALRSLGSDVTAGLSPAGAPVGEVRAGSALSVNAAGRAWLAAATLSPQGAQLPSVSVAGYDAIVGALPADVGGDRMTAGAAPPADLSFAYHLTLPGGMAGGGVQVSASGGLASVRVAQATGAASALRIDRISGGDVFVETSGLDTLVLSAQSGDDLYVSAYGGDAILRGGALTRTFDAAGDGFNLALKATGAGKRALLGADVALDAQGQPIYATASQGAPNDTVTGLDPNAPTSGADSVDIVSTGGDAGVNLIGAYRISTISAAGSAYALATGDLQAWSLIGGSSVLAASLGGNATVEQAAAGSSLILSAGGVAGLRTATLTAPALGAGGGVLLVSGGQGAVLGRAAGLGGGAADPLSPRIQLAMPSSTTVTVQTQVGEGGDAIVDLDGDNALTHVYGDRNTSILSSGALSISQSATAGTGALTIAAGGPATLASLASGGSSQITAGGALSLSSLQAGGAATLTSGGDLGAGSLSAGGPVSLVGGGDVTVAAGLSTTSALNVSAGSALDLANVFAGGAAQLLAGQGAQLSSLAAQSLLVRTGGGIVAAGLGIGATAEFSAMGTVQLGSTSAAGGSVGQAAEVRAGGLHVLGGFSASTLTVEARYGGLTLGSTATMGSALSLGQSDLDNLSGPAGGRLALSLYAGLKPNALIQSAVFPGETSLAGAVTVGALSLDGTRLSSLSLYTAPAYAVTIKGALAPATGVSAVALTIGDAADGAWRPGSIVVVNDGRGDGATGSIGAATSPATGLRPFATVSLNAAEDVLMGSTDFINAVAGLPAADIDPTRNIPLVAPNVSGAELLVAGSLSVQADGKVLQQSTSAGLGMGSGIVLGGANVDGPLLTLNSDAAAVPGAFPQKPGIVNLYLTLNASGTLIGNQVTATSDRIHLIVAPSDAYRVNGCIIGVPGNCTPLDTFIVNIQPDRLTEVDLLRRAEDDAQEDPTVAGAANEEIWRKPDQP